MSGEFRARRTFRGLKLRLLDGVRTGRRRRDGCVGTVASAAVHDALALVELDLDAAPRGLVDRLDQADVAQAHLPGVRTSVSFRIASCAEGGDPVM